MNIAIYLQDRQYGFTTHKRRQFKVDQLGKFLDEKSTESLVNKACSVSGTCRSTFIMEFSPDGTKVASTHGDHTVRISDIATGQCVRTLQGHPRTPWCLAYHPSSSHILASGCLGGQVRIWDLYGYGCEVWQSENSSVIASLTFHPTDHVLVIGTGNSLYFWDWSQPEPFTKCSTSHEYERIRWVRFDRLGHNLYTGISNNTVLHRDEVSSVSLNSQNPTPAPRQPSRLSNVYSRIINYYQEYRRERLAQETSGGQEAGPSRQPDAQETDPFPGVRDIDIVEPRSPSNTQSFDNPRSGQTNSDSASTNQSSQITVGCSQTRQVPNSRLSSDCLINPNNDPFLPIVSYTSSSESTSVSRGVGSFYGQPLPTNNSVTDPSSLHSFTRHSVRDTDTSNLEEGPIVVCNEDTIFAIRNSTVSEENSANRLNITRNTTNERNNVSSSSTSSSSVVSKENAVANSSVQALSESIRSSISSCSDINPYLARYLKTQASRKNTQTSTSSTIQPTKTFPSIRDRLKINIPLSSQPSANLSTSSKVTGIPPVTVLPDNTETGIPPVTVLSGNRDTGVPPVRVLSGNREATEQTGIMLSGNRETGTHPVTVSSCNGETGLLPVTVLSSSRENGVPPITVIHNRRMTSVPPATIIPTSNSLKHGTVQSNTDTAIPQVSLVFPYSSEPNLSTPGLYNSETFRMNETPASGTEYRNASTSETTLSTKINTDKVSSENYPQGSISTTQATSASLNPENNQGHGTSEGVQSVLKEFNRTSQDSSSFEGNSNTLSNQNHLRSLKHPVTSRLNLFENVQRARFQRRMRNSGVRHQPYRLPTPHESLSLMGPYLASRGYTGSQSVSDTLNNGGNTCIERTSSQILSQESRELGPNNELIASRNANSNSSLTNASVSVSNSNSCFFFPISSNSTESSSNNCTISESSMSAGRRVDHASDNQSIELVVDQNENYTAVRDANNIQATQAHNEVQVGNNDSNNNSLHIVQQPDANVAVTLSTNNQTDRDYIALRNTFVSMTDQIEREMSDLNRRINALRDSFNQSLFSLRQDRQRFESVGQGVDAVLSGDGVSDDQTVGGNRPPGRLPVIVTDESQSDENETDDIDTQGFMIQPPTLLETSLRSHRRGRQGRFLQRPMLEEAAEPQDWRQLQRHYLHPHYSSSIFDETINRPSNAIQSAINRAIAGAFMGTGESAVANNIINQTHRIQCWNFTRCHIPDITSCDENVVVLHCKLHNSASCDISPNSALLATFVPSHHGFPDDNILAVYSILPENLGQCLYTKSFGPNAISISISPSNNHILVGLAAKKLSWVFTARQMVAQIYRLDKQEAGEKSTKLVKDIFHTCSSDIRSQVSGNSARWLPLLGQGLIYGTNRGHLNFCKPGVKTPVRKIASSELQNYELTEENPSETSRRFTLRRVPWLTHTDPHRVSASTQTPAASHTTATQTETDSRESQI